MNIKSTVLTVTVVAALASSLTACSGGSKEGSTPSATTVLTGMDKVIKESNNVTLQMPVKDSDLDTDTVFKIYRGSEDSEATMKLIASGGTAVVRKVEGKEFLKGDAAYYKAVVKDKTPQELEAMVKAAGNKWVEIPKGSATPMNYDLLLKEMKFNDVNLLTNMMTAVEKTQLNGKDVYKIADKSGDKDFFYTSADGKFEPIELHTTVEEAGKGKNKVVLKFSNWNTTTPIEKIDPKDIFKQ